MESEEAFFKRLYETFKVEAHEHISNLTKAFLELEKDYQSIGTKNYLEGVFREAHSLKGAARSVGKDTIQNICQSFENLLAALLEKKLDPTRELFETAFEVLDYISTLLDSEEDKIDEPEIYTELINRLNEICQDQHPTFPSASAEISPPKVKIVTPVSKEEPVQKTAAAAPAEKISSQQATEKKAVIKEETFFKTNKLIKLSSHKMEELISQIEELMTVKSMYGNLRSSIAQVMTIAQDTEKLYKSLIVTKQFIKHRIPEKEPYYDRANLLVEQVFNYVNETLLLIVSSLDKTLRESFHDNHVIDNMTSTLLDDTKKLLMQPFSTLLEPFPKMVRDISKKLGKDIDFQIEGESIEIDRRILDELKDPLIHMVRNSIDHGIESPEQRSQLNKPTSGKISILISQIGSNHIEMMLADDGGGFPLEKLKNKAIKARLISSLEAENITEEEIIKLALHSGISSSDIITEISGRGVGLGILSEKIEKMGGYFSIHTKSGKGTIFNLSLPMTRATFRGLHVLTAQRNFIIPTQNISRILRKGGYELTSVENQKVVMIKDKNYPYRSLHSLLNLDEAQESAPNLILLITSGSHEIAVGIDKIVNEEEVFIKGLGAALQHIPNISAATILEGGRIIPILDCRDLVRSATLSTVKRTRTVEKEKSKIVKSAKILLAEDTATTRLLFKNILEGNGYTVLVAENGAEALQILKTTEIDLLITDIEMPYMTGFELIAHLRKESQLQDIPIIIITALESKRDKEKGIELGANAFIEKSRFIQNELLSIVRKLL